MSVDDNNMMNGMVETLDDYEQYLVDMMQPKTEEEWTDVLHIAKICWDQTHNLQLMISQTQVSDYEQKVLSWTGFEMRNNTLRFIDPDVDRQHCEALPRLLN